MQRITILLLLILSTAACKKFLESKPDQKLVVPSTLKDLQALLDYYPKINFSVPSAAEVSADDYYLTTADWSAMSSESNRRMFIWEKANLFDVFPNNWSQLYEVVYYANTVLENLEKIERTIQNQTEWEHIKSQALFIRANAFFHLVQVWSLAYDENTAVNDLGIPLRTSSDFNITVQRSSVKETYHKIEQDLLQSITALPVIPKHVMRASKPAAYALLARLYLAKRNYIKMGLYADSCLQLKATLLNYNIVSGAPQYPFPEFNTEVIFQNEMSAAQPINNSRAKIDSVLYASYETNDLRKTLFFRNNNNGTFGFRGSYNGQLNMFGGIAVDEVLLMRAEAYARENNLMKAMNDLNTLLITRYKTGTFTARTAATQQEALSTILAERRKQLLMRGLRWMDIKRLNKETAFQKTLKRKIGADEYQLPPGDLRYALPIPEAVIAISRIQQNPR